MIVQIINNAGHHLMEWEVKDILGRMKILVGLTGWVDHVSPELQLVTAIMIDRWTFAVALKKSSLQWHEREEGLWGCWILWRLPQQGTDTFVDNLFYLNLEIDIALCRYVYCIFFLPLTHSPDNISFHKLLILSESAWNVNAMLTREHMFSDICKWSDQPNSQYLSEGNLGRDEKEWANNEVVFV